MEHSLNSERELLLQALIILVRRQVKPVEAGVATWKPRRVTRLLDGESPGSIRSLQILEAINRHSRGSGGELKQASFLFRGPRPDALPEPFDDLVGLLVAAVVGKLTPVVPEDAVSTSALQ